MDVMKLKEKNGASSGTGVYFPAALQAALKQGIGSLGKAQKHKKSVAVSPVGTPTSCSSRSNSFTSSSSTTGMQAERKPPQHSASCRATSVSSSSTQDASSARKSPFYAAAGQAHAAAGQVHPTTQPGYGRFSLDESTRRTAPLLPGQGVATSGGSFTNQSCSTRPSWPTGPTMRNSLSVPTDLSTGGVPSFGKGDTQQLGSLVAGQEQPPFYISLAPETCMLHAAGAARLNSSQHGSMCLTSQPLQEEQLLAQQHQQQQLQLRVQSALEEQLLLQQLGAMSSQPCSQQAGNQYVCDSVLAPQLQDSSAGRRLSYTGLPQSGAGLDLLGSSMLGSIALVGTQLRQAASTPLPPMDPESTRQDALDCVLEAELDAALQQLLKLRNEVELRKARAGVAAASISSVAAAPPAAGVPGSLLAAGVQLSQLYQHSASPALGSVPSQPYQPAAPRGDNLGRGSLYQSSDAQIAAALSSQLYQPSAAGASLACPYGSVGSSQVAPAAPQVTLADALAPQQQQQRSSFSGFAPVMGATPAPLGDFSLGVPGVPAFGAMPGSDACPLQSSLGQLLAHGGTMADWLSSDTAAHVAAAQRSLQQERQLAAAAQGGLVVMAAGQLSATGYTPQTSFALQPQTAQIGAMRYTPRTSFDLQPQGLYMHGL